MYKIAFLNKYKNIHILGNSLILLLITLVSKFSMFALTILSARYLVPSEFGKLALLRSTASLIEGVVTGVNGSLIIAEMNKEEDKSNFIGIVFSTVAFLFLSISFFLIFNWLQHDTLLVYSDIIFIIVFSVFLVLSTAINFVFIGKEWYKDNLLIVALATSIALPLSISLIVIYKFNGAIFAFLLFVVIELIFKIFLIYKRRDVFTFIFDSNYLRLTIRAFKYVLIITLPLVIFWFLKFNLAKSSIVDLAKFELVYQFLTVIMLITGAISSASMKNFHLSSGVEVLKFSILINAVISLFLILFFYSVGDKILNLINDSYILKDEGHTFLLILLIALPFSLNGVLNKYFISKSMDYVNFFSSAFSIFAVITYIGMLGKYGMETLITSYLLYYSLSSVGQVFFLIKKRVIL